MGMTFDEIMGKIYNNEHKNRPNSVIHTLLYGTEMTRCPDCGKVVLYSKDIIDGEEYYCVFCNHTIGLHEVGYGDEQTPEEFDEMLDMVQQVLRLDD